MILSKRDIHRLKKGTLTGGDLERLLTSHESLREAKEKAEGDLSTEKLMFEKLVAEARQHNKEIASLSTCCARLGNEKLRLERRCNGQAVTIENLEAENLRLRRRGLLARIWAWLKCEDITEEIGTKLD